MKNALIAFLASLAAVTATAATTVNVIEYYNAAQDHFFITSIPAEITALDNGQFVGWSRTGRMFEAYPGPTGNASPVCRFLIPPALGDSHFYSASPAECAQVAATYPTFVEESAAVMYMDLPNTTTGACPSGDIPVYRVWDNRADSNHRYTVDLQLRQQMVSLGWVAEGYGPNQVIMCAPLATPSAAPPPPCVGTNPNVAVPGAPHGLYVWNPLSAQNQALLAKDTIGKDPSLCGASLVINWADVEPTQGNYNWPAVIAAAQPYVDADLTVNLLFSEFTEGTVNNVTPAWVTAPVSQGGAGAAFVTCTGYPAMMPVYWDPAYENAWMNFIAAAVQQFSKQNSKISKNVGYLRFATGGGAEALAPAGYNTPPCENEWISAGYSYNTWNAHVARIINNMGSQPTDKQIMVSLPQVPGGPTVYTVSNLAAAVAEAKGVGFSFESMGDANVASATSTPASCNPNAAIATLHWCQAYTTYAGKVPLAAQPITATTTTTTVTMDIGKLLQYGLANHIQIFELYPEEWLQANSPTWPGFDPTKQAAYQAALQAASQIVGATNGR